MGNVMVLTRRQQEIIDTALNLTAEKGIQSLTIKNLGSELGISEPAIYRHFRSKSEIIKTMINGFDLAVPTGDAGRHGFEAVAWYVRKRLQQVIDQPALAKVMFSEELFMGDPEWVGLLLRMMHRHREALGHCFHEAQETGEIRRGLSDEMLFCLVFGPVRMLVKQWGMSERAFDLRERGEALLATLRTILR